MRRLGKVCGVLLLGAVVTGMTLWAIGALYYSPLPLLLGQLLAIVCGLATAGALLGLPRRRRTLLGFGLVWGTLVLWWSTIPASHSRDWQPDVAVLPSATLAGDRVTLHHIRNFAYRTAADFTPRYDDKTVDLQHLESVDLISSYWAGEAIAHLLVSFGFGEQDYVAISIATRKERTEDYASIKGFFKQYELIYVVADERDVLRLRTTYRQPPEAVALSRTRIPPARARRLFRDSLREVHQLVAQPAFSNTLSTNCTTNIVFHARASGGIARYNWKILLSGYAPAYVDESGGLDTSLSFAELKQRSHLNARAPAADEAPDFSQRLRAGRPRPPPAGG